MAPVKPRRLSEEVENRLMTHGCRGGGVVFFLPGSGHRLRVADGEADHLGDIHSADRHHAAVVLVVAQKSPLQGTPAASQVWEKEKKKGKEKPITAPANRIAPRIHFLSAQISFRGNLKGF